MGGKTFLLRPRPHCRRAPIRSNGRLSRQNFVDGGWIHAWRVCPKIEKIAENDEPVDGICALIGILENVVQKRKHIGFVNRLLIPACLGVGSDVNIANDDCLHSYFLIPTLGWPELSSGFAAIA